MATPAMMMEMDMLVRGRYQNKKWVDITSVIMLTNSREFRQFIFSKNNS